MRACGVATSRSIAALFVQPSFPDCTGILQTKPSPAGRAGHRTGSWQLAPEWPREREVAVSL